MFVSPDLWLDIFPRILAICMEYIFHVEFLQCHVWSKSDGCVEGKGPMYILNTHTVNFTLGSMTLNTNMTLITKEHDSIKAYDTNTARDDTLRHENLANVPSDTGILRVHHRAPSCSLRLQCLFVRRKSCTCYAYLSNTNAQAHALRPH